ncbi:phage holin family protein [Zafaria sp. J156]|uniref:hypothetical protein n=1 Tax=Zafaria sp. J156 TaxID=3116490 RepID=UPI002E788AD9|nr:hypothetical protein [Zafaria sp. J156]MEE1621454.1 hypothetical protein [Zafaria sp. J156]
MIRLLLSIAVNLIGSALALLVASWVIEGVTLQLGGFLVAVGIFTAAQAILAPFVFNMARKYASAVLGGIGLVSTLLALWVATLFPGGLEITGGLAWVAATVLVWLVTALGAWILAALVIDRWWQRRQGTPRQQRHRPA